MTITFHEYNLPKAIKPYSIEVEIIIGRVANAPAVLMPTTDGDWELTIRNHADTYSGRVKYVNGEEKP